MTDLMGPPEKESRGFFVNYDVSVVVTILLAVGFAITLATVGLWEAVRNFAVEAVILGAAFWLARTYLPWEDAPRERIKRPRFELIAGLVAYVLALYGSDLFFRDLAQDVEGRGLALFAAAGLIAVGVLWGRRYPAASWGLRLPRGRDWLVALAVAAIVFAVSALASNFLPEGEIPGPIDVPLRQLMDRGSTAFIILPGWAALVVLAVSDEFFFRVFLQPRLAAYMSGRWALFWQAVLYSLMFMPMFYFANGYGLPHSIALTLILSNGILAGYFWRKTGSLPLLILLNLLAFTRWGL